MFKKLRVFGRTRDLEQQIDNFLKNISESAMLFRMAVKEYLKHGHTEDYRTMLDKVNSMETDADNLRRDIERELYLHTLIPESRGDVLGLIENLDQLLGLFQGALWRLENERPQIPSKYRNDMKRLSSHAVKSVEAVILSARAFFYSPHSVSEHNHAVMFYEKEADKVGSNLKSELFASDLDLSQKLQLRDVAESIDNIADWAEDVADRLAIYAIKRTV